MIKYFVAAQILPSFASYLSKNLIWILWKKKFNMFYSIMINYLAKTIIYTLVMFMQLTLHLDYFNVT